MPMIGRQPPAPQSWHGQVRVVAIRRDRARAPFLGWIEPLPVAAAPRKAVTRAQRLSAMAAAEAETTRERRDTLDSAQRGRPYRQFPTSDLGVMGGKCADGGDEQGVSLILDELAQRSSLGALRLRERMLQRRALLAVPMAVRIDGAPPA